MARASRVLLMLLVVLLMSCTPGWADDTEIPVESPSPAPTSQAGGPQPAGLQMSGEIALRYERDQQQPVKADRGRYRNRLGWVYQPDNHWTYGFHFRTGSPFNQNSTFTTMDQHQTSGWTVDEAYIRYQPTSSWQVDAGEFSRPWHTNPVYTGAVWSSAIKAGGFNVSYHPTDSPYYLSVGPWVSMPQDVGHYGDFQVLGIQGGRTWNVAPNQRFDLSLGLLYFGFDSNGLGTLLGRNQGNAVLEVKGKPFAFASGYNIIDPRLDYYFATVHHIPLAATAEYFVNVASSAPGIPINGKSGYDVGLVAGKVQYPGKISVRLQYFNIGQDSVFTPVVQGDFVQATNFDGFYFNATVPLTPRLNAALVCEHTDRSAVNPLQNRTAFDLYYRY